MENELFWAAFGEECGGSCGEPTLPLQDLPTDGSEHTQLPEPCRDSSAGVPCPSSAWKRRGVQCCLQQSEPPNLVCCKIMFFLFYRVGKLPFAITWVYNGLELLLLIFLRCAIWGNVQRLNWWDPRSDSFSQAESGYLVQSVSWCAELKYLWSEWWNSCEIN